MLEPWGFEADEARFGMLGQLIASTVGGQLAAKDFTIRPPPTAEEQELMDQDALIRKFRDHFAGRSVDERAAPTSTPQEKLGT